VADSNRASTQALTFRQQLADDPYGYEFFQVLRLLEALGPAHARLGETSRAVRETIRLAQEPSLAFPTSMVSRFEPAAEGGKDRLEVRFLGLFGPQGPMPLHITEYVQQRDLHSGDSTFRRFADVFHHRMLSLFYRAWANAQPCVGLDRPDGDQFFDYVGSLIGIGQPGARDHDVLDDHTRLYYSGALAMQNGPADGLEAIVEDYLGIPTVVDEFVGEWLEIPPQFRLRLGETEMTGTVGDSATAGEKAWSCQSRFRLVCGPMSYEKFRRLMPDRDVLERLAHLVRSYAGDALSWDVNLILNRQEVPALRLGEDGHLGWTTWLGNRPSDTDAADVLLRPMDLASESPESGKASAG
jgi:type VI secretion system protein ImpH